MAAEYIVAKKITELIGVIEKLHSVIEELHGEHDLSVIWCVIFDTRAHAEQLYPQNGGCRKRLTPSKA